MQAKLVKRHPRNVILASELDCSKRTVNQVANAISQQIEERKLEIINQYKSERRYEKDFLENLSPEIRKNLSFLHDYKQFIARVRRNINVVLETRHLAGELDDKLARALPAEAAIYWASVLMEEKLTTAFLLLQPELALGMRTP